MSLVEAHDWYPDWEFWRSVKATVADLKKSICEKFPELVPQEWRPAVAVRLHALGELRGSL